MSEQQERLVATIHVPLSLRYINDFADALQDAVGEKLYFKGADDCVFRIVSLGEPHEPEDEHEDRG